jgi:hypothetical protein
MGTPSRLFASVMLGLVALHSSAAEAQVVSGPRLERVTNLASAVTGLIEGTVMDEAGKPLDGAVISALGSTTAFAVSDKSGAFSLRQLPPGPYLLRVHLPGFMTARSAMVNVRPSARSASTFTLRREGTAAAPRIADAAVGVTGTQVGAAPATAAKGDGRDESDFAWRLRHLKRGVLKDAQILAGIPQDDDWFITDSVKFLGRAVGTSAKATTALFSDLSLGGQVNLLTTGAFDNPLQLLQLDRTSSVAFFSLGAPVGSHGDWAVRAAMNQSDLSSWMLAGNYVVTAPATHRYQFGMSYSLQRYEGGNAAALLAVADTARNVGSVFGFDEWRVSRYLSVGYGAGYAHYDYMIDGGSLFSPRLSVTLSPTTNTRLRATAVRQVSAPGAEEFLPPSSAEYLPPQRTFSALSPQAGLRPQEMLHYEVGFERVFNGATVGVRAFQQHIDNQTVTVFGLRQPDAAATALGHYYVGAAGDASLRGVGLTVTHALAENIRGVVDYSVSTADWARTTPVEYALLTTWVPSAVRESGEKVHDVTTSLETEIPLSATRMVLLYKLNNAFVAGQESRNGFDARFDLQINQALPFMNFRTSQWEMLLSVRNLFHESLANGSVYDELLVVRPPKRVVGGLTVKF